MPERQMPERPKDPAKKAEEKKEAQPQSTSRRSFLIGAGTGVAGLVVGGAAGSQLFPKAPAKAPEVATPALWVGRKMDACTGCKECQIACSLFHDKKIWPATSRVRVHEFPPGVEFPVLCYQCGTDAKCISACQVDAVSINPADSTIKFDLTKCLRTAKNGDCTLCADACPGSSIIFHPTSRAPISCDLCDGDPQCPKVCPKGALTLKGTRSAVIAPKEIAAGLQKLYTLPPMPQLPPAAPPAAPTPTPTPKPKTAIDDNSVAYSDPTSLMI